MPIQYLDDQAVFEGHCEPEEADALLEWLRRTPEPKADLGGCVDLHTALAQLLMVARVRVAVPPADDFLAALLNGATLSPEPSGAAGLNEKIV